jgi:hypothetical protein
VPSPFCSLRAEVSGPAAAEAPGVSWRGSRYPHVAVARRVRHSTTEAFVPDGTGAARLCPRPCLCSFPRGWLLALTPPRATPPGPLPRGLAARPLVIFAEHFPLSHPVLVPKITGWVACDPHLPWSLDLPGTQGQSK